MKDLFAADFTAVSTGKDTKPMSIRFGKLLGNTVIQFEKSETSSLNLTGKSKG